MEVEVHEESLPGIGRRYEVAVGEHRVVVTVSRTGRRELAIATAGADEPDAAVSLNAEEAVAIASVLMSVRFDADPGGPAP